MDILNGIFKRKKVNIPKLSAYGFSENSNGFSFNAILPGSGFQMTVAITREGVIKTTVTDVETAEPYTLHLSDGASGSFVGGVKAEYEQILTDIAQKCFDPDVFKSVQAKEIIDYVRAEYQDELEFLWQKFPDNAVWRRKDNKKWYGAILTVSRNKLGIRSNEMVEIIDLRINPEQMKATIDNEKYFPGWHMNKNNWYTIILDGSVSTAEICRRVDESYNLAIKQTPCKNPS